MRSFHVWQLGSQVFNVALAQEIASILGPCSLQRTLSLKRCMGYLPDMLAYVLQIDYLHRSEDQGSEITILFSTSLTPGANQAASSAAFFSA